MSRSFGGRSLTTRSPMVISPAVISSSPATMRSVVDLPHPDGPTSTTNSLSWMWRFTSLTAWTSSYFLFRSFIITWAIDVSPRSECRDGTPCCPQRASAFHGPGEAGDIVLDEEGVDESHRDRAQQRPRHERAPEEDVAPDQLGDDADRHRLLLRGGEEDERVDELVPGQREGENSRRQDAGRGDRENDLDHGPHPRGPVDARALFQLFRDRLEVSHHQPRAKRDEECRIGQDQRPWRVAEPEVADDVGQRDEEERRRHEVGHEDARAEAPRQREAEPGQGVAGQEPAEERDHRGNDRDEHRVPEPGREHRLREEIEHVLDGGLGSPERRVVDRSPRPVQLTVGPEGGHQHPVEREQCADDEERQRDVEEDPLAPQRALDHARAGARAACHHAPSTRRMYQSWITTMMKSIGNISETAAPSPRSPVLMPIWYA